MVNIIIYCLLIGQESDERLETAKRAVSVNQHHDAVTGTAKQHVTDDYALRLHNGMMACDQVMRETLSSVSGCTLEASCHLLNISQCAFTEKFSDTMSVTLYNPLTTHITHPVRLPVSDCKTMYQVTDKGGSELEYQLVPLPSEVKNIPGRVSKASCELVFLTSKLPPLGISTFTISKVAGLQTEPKMLEISSGFTLSNAHVNISFNDNAEILSVGTPDTMIKLHQDFAFYRGAVGDNMRAENRASGAYIFRPVNQTPQPIGQPQSASVIRGCSVVKY